MLVVKGYIAKNAHLQLFIKEFLDKIATKVKSYQQIDKGAQVYSSIDYLIHFRGVRIGYGIVDDKKLSLTGERQGEYWQTFNYSSWPPPINLKKTYELVSEVSPLTDGDQSNLPE